MFFQIFLPYSFRLIAAQNQTKLDPSLVSQNRVNVLVVSSCYCCWYPWMLLSSLLTILAVLLLMTSMMMLLSLLLRPSMILTAFLLLLASILFWWSCCHFHSCCCLRSCCCHNIAVILAVACVTAIACIQTVAGILVVAGVLLVPDGLLLLVSLPLLDYQTIRPWLSDSYFFLPSNYRNFEYHICELRNYRIIGVPQYRLYCVPHLVEERSRP